MPTASACKADASFEKFGFRQGRTAWPGKKRDGAVRTSRPASRPIAGQVCSHVLLSLASQDRCAELIQVCSSLISEITRLVQVRTYATPDMVIEACS